MDAISQISEKHTGPESIADSVYAHYNVNKSDIQEIYNNYRLYNRIMQYARKSKIDKEEARRKSKETYYCELCEKDVRVAVKYHHLRTMKHIKLHNEVEKQVQALRDREEQKE